MMCVQDAVENRTNSCELFGYDFMIDEHYNPWLIEVNSSPACDYSTPVAEKIVKKGLADALKVVVDHREWSQKVRLLLFRFASLRHLCWILTAPSPLPSVHQRANRRRHRRRRKRRPRRRRGAGR